MHFTNAFHSQIISQIFDKSFTNHSQMHFANRQANGQWSFRFRSTADFFSCVGLGFWTALFESTYGRLLLEQYFSFRDLVIRPLGLLQAPSQLNDNSLLKTFFQRSIYDCIQLLYLCIVFMM